MSNLTSISEDASVSSGNRPENFIMSQDFSTLSPMFPTISPLPQQQTVKRKRNLPGNPDPDAEVIALSPKTLMATNRFVCEICNKGFQRDQNLQLHRRGHNLPWKLRQRSSKEIRKRVYVCPELTCVHHDPSRALGDLTGIKKHFCRKHGEKKWKCEKCSKKYAVQSDWKAHSKTCGTREYRCDCGTLFSRKDSFITHRAFCDALAEESARLSGPINQMAFSATPLPMQTQLPSSLTQQASNLLSLRWDQNLQNQEDNKPDIPIILNPKPSLLNLSNPMCHQSFSSNFESSQNCQKQALSGFLTSVTSSLSSPIFSNNAISNSSSSSPHMSATALLQKAAEIGATVSGNCSNSHSTLKSISSQAPNPGFSLYSVGMNSWQDRTETDDNVSEMSNMVNSISAAKFGSILAEMNGMSNMNGMSAMNGLNGLERENHGNPLTRDFLGVGEANNMGMRELLSFAGMDLCMSSCDPNQSLKQASASPSTNFQFSESWDG
ncbi:hypothetical protein AMTRI_Chr03g148270 [Amborella trichopoda]|uniref:C2H2-type domain-containing protein n=1 Tax=Amborella trichopoda TaxID=13333 RepID=W1P1R3_AMBTC|nr:protein indeterminate-domain 12 [Amborella trichopoda]XP_020520208.1 protein indeterminate-domain 12 [Amborella trichopoda]ERN01511.1 hypothetical protein AMTR_s00002p00270520 [Amborella trichopoda]|eukprot:XP_006838942.1 protein indeterminate-domain 12 [Amborella trichopoda]